METRQFKLSYLFAVTFSVAVGCAMLGSSIPWLQSIGLGVVLYWAAKAFFVASVRLPTGLRELVFLVGFPAYLAAVVCVVSGLISLFLSFRPHP